MPQNIGPSNYRLLWRRRIAEFRSFDAAFAFLLRFRKDRIAMADLRTILDQSSAGFRGKRLNDDQVLRGVAKLLASGEVFLAGEPVRHGGNAMQSKDASSPAAAAPARALRTPKTWIEIELIDDNGDPVPGEAFRIVLPDGRVVRGHLDSDGRARFGNIDPGTCEVSFPGIDAPEWDAA